MDGQSDRRAIVKGLGAGMVALAAGALGRRAAGAAPRGKSACAKACQAQFPAKGQRGQRRRCVARCVRGE